MTDIATSPSPPLSVRSAMTATGVRFHVSLAALPARLPPTWDSSISTRPQSRSSPTTNMGAQWPHISTQVRELLADVLAQVSDFENSPWSADELAARFHHRLVAIHPFPNGNGRHSRLAADLLVDVLGEPAFTWGSENLSSPGRACVVYLEALRTADRLYDYRPLVEFARS